MARRPACDLHRRDSRRRDARIGRGRTRCRRRHRRRPVRHSSRPLLPPVHPRDREVTLIEAEALEALERDHGISLSGAESRRNLLTEGVPLNHLVGRCFAVGATVLQAGRLNTPCRYFERLIDKPVFSPLLNRSGLNCRIVVGGTIRAGDAIGPLAPDAAARLDQDQA
ncbi:MAG: MOSC domain-containing protein [Gemmatimonadaceae bacterium]